MRCTKGIVAYRRNGGPFVFTDDFNRSNSTNLGSDWSEADGLNTAVFEIDANGLGVITGAGTAGFARCTQTIPSDDHYVEVVYRTATSGSQSTIGMLARATSPLGPSGSFYIALWSRTAGNVRTWQITKFVSGSATNLVNVAGSQPSNGDVLRFEVVGTSLVLKLNGTTVASTTDSAISSGSYAGVRLDGQDTSIDSFEIGTL